MNKLTKYLALFTALVVLQLGNLSLANDKQIAIAYSDYPPYYGDSLSDKGPLLDIIIAAFAHQGYQIKLDQMPWSRALKWTNEGRYDALCCAWYRKDREETMLFGPALPGTILSFVKKTDAEINFDGFESLQSLSIGVVRDYALPKGMTDANLSVQPANSDLQNLNKLMADRVDLVLMDQAQANFLIRTHMPEKSARIEFVEPSILEEAMYLTFSRANTNAQQLAKDFEAGLNHLKESGAFGEILNKHGFLTPKSPNQ